MHRFDPLAEVEHTLDALVDRELVTRLARRPGQKEERFTELLGEADVVARAAAPAEPVFERRPDIEQRVESLEAEVARLSAALDELQSNSGR